MHSYHSSLREFPPGAKSRAGDNYAGTATYVGVNNGVGELTLTGTSTVKVGTLSIGHGTNNTQTANGTVTVFDGGTLNASSIVCNTLTIGGTPPPSSAASFTNANSVPEPSTIAMLILAGLSLIGWTVRRCR